MLKPISVRLLATLTVMKVLAAEVLVADALFLSMPLKAQEHRHPPADSTLHEQFYSTWMMPDHPKSSCCNKADCYPTEAKFENGNWYGKRREDGKWLLIPPKKVEQLRDMPDTRAHMCAPRPDDLRFMGKDTVFCFGISPGI